MCKKPRPLTSLSRVVVEKLSVTPLTMLLRAYREVVPNLEFNNREVVPNLEFNNREVVPNLEFNNNQVTIKKTCIAIYSNWRMILKIMQ